jgi:Zn-dependent oligopeptidase
VQEGMSSANFEKWLKRPEILMSLSCHHTTGQPLTEDLAARLIKGISCFAFVLQFHV